MPLKNTPYVNDKLRHVAHMLDIKPLRFPHGLPQHESDYEHTDLRPSGNLYIKKQITGLYRDEESEPNPKAKHSITDNTIKKHLDREKQTYKIHAEYFKPDYVYEKNQDGKEFRYAQHGYAKKPS